MNLLESIQNAAEVIDPVFLNSPCFRSETTGLWLKVETINPIRSFKGRGAAYYVSNVKDLTPIVCASAGNFGQGMAYAARASGVPLYVFAAETANRLKVRRMRALGAEIHQVGHDFDEAKLRAREFAAAQKYHWVEDGREPAIAAGAGTIGLELASSNLDAVLVPVGNGALISGMGTAIKALSPETKVIGVCAEGAPCMERSWRNETVESTPAVATIADGIGVRTPVPEALDMMEEVVDEILLVSDSAMIDAMRQLFQDHGLIVEPAGAAGVAAWHTHQPLFRKQQVGTVLCGGNLTTEQVREYLL